MMPSVPSAPTNSRVRSYPADDLRARHEPIGQVLGGRELVRRIRVHRHDQVEVAVTDVADNRRQQAHVGDIALRLFDAFGKT